MKGIANFVKRLEKTLDTQEALNNFNERLFDRHDEAIQSCHKVIEELLAEREGGPKIPDYEISYLKEQLKRYREQQ